MTTQLDRVANQIRHKRRLDARKEAERRALAILAEYTPETFDPREIAVRIADAVKDLVDK